MTARKKTLNDWVDLAYGTAKSKGFHDEDVITSDMVMRWLMLIVSELGEAADEVRMVGFDPEDPETWVTIQPTGKPTGFATEVADAVIRLMDLCGAMGIDLEAEIARKTAYNATREHRHGKTC